MQTRVDFYLPKNSDDRDVFTCRLVEKAFNERLTIWLWTKNAKQLIYFDQLLWVFKVNSFIPHDVIEPDDAKPADANTTDLQQDHPAAAGNDTTDTLLKIPTLPQVYLATHLDGLQAQKLGVNCLVNLSQDVADHPEQFQRIADVLDPDDIDSGRERFIYYKDSGLELYHHQV